MLFPPQSSLEINPNLMESGGWTRDTLWRQGSAIPDRISVSLGLKVDSSPSEVAIVISHDCDIAEDNLTNEPNLEGIVGELIADPLPNHTHAKSPNKLHLAISVDSESRFIELRANRKFQVKKTALASDKPDPRFSLTARGREILQSWLAIRYKRAAFPDCLNKHLSLLRDTLQKVGGRNPEAVIGFYIYYEPDEEISVPEEPYEVWIVVVYNHELIGAKDFAQEAAQKISERFEKKFKSALGWRNVDLRGCEAASDKEFSLHDAMVFKNYPLEYISLRASENKG